MMSEQYGYFANYGFLKDQLPAELLQHLKDEISEIDLASAGNKHNQNLAGNIEHEYKLSKNSEELESYLISLCNKYAVGWTLKNTAKDLRADDLQLQSYWVNFQKKHEFNPLHSHDGTYSFAIWIKVPYKIQDELNSVYSNQTNMPRSGMFSFVYTNIFGEIREAEFPVDETYEGTIFLFPSCLLHTVYPFSTSDEYRISLSGNLKRK
jgi:hypothetical protein